MTSDNHRQLLFEVTDRILKECPTLDAMSAYSIAYQKLFMATNPCETCWVSPCQCDDRAEFLLETVRDMGCDVAYCAYDDSVFFWPHKRLTDELAQELGRFRIALAKRSDVTILY